MLPFSVVFTVLATSARQFHRGLQRGKRTKCLLCTKEEPGHGDNQKQFCLTQGKLDLKAFRIFAFSFPFFMVMGWISH